MTMLEKIVYIADYIEPARNKAPRLTEIRRLAFEDLDECMYQILKDTLSYLDENPNDVDSATKDAYAYYTMLHEDRLKIRKQADPERKHVYEQRTGNGKHCLQSN